MKPDAHWGFCFPHSKHTYQWATESAKAEVGSLVRRIFFHFAKKRLGLRRCHLRKPALRKNKRFSTVSPFQISPWTDSDFKGKRQFVTIIFSNPLFGNVPEWLKGRSRKPLDSVRASSSLVVVGFFFLRKSLDLSSFLPFSSLLRILFKNERFLCFGLCHLNSLNKFITTRMHTVGTSIF